MIHFSVILPFCTFWGLIQNVLYAVLKKKYIYLLLAGLQPMIFSMENRKLSAKRGQVFSIILELAHIDLFTAVFWWVFIIYLFILFATENLFLSEFSALKDSRDNINCQNGSLLSAHRDQTCNQTCLQGLAYCLKWVGETEVIRYLISQIQLYPQNQMSFQVHFALESFAVWLGFEVRCAGDIVLWEHGVCRVIS